VTQSQKGHLAVSWPSNLANKRDTLSLIGICTLAQKMTSFCQSENFIVLLGLRVQV